MMSVSVLTEPDPLLKQLKDLEEQIELLYADNTQLRTDKKALLLEKISFDEIKSALQD